MPRITDRYIQDGDVITLVAPYALTPGDGCLVGSTFGVALGAAAISTPVEVAMEGVFDIAKTAGQTPAQGALAYWDNTAKSVTTVSTSNSRIGSFTQAALAGDATCRVRLSGAPAVAGVA